VVGVPEQLPPEAPGVLVTSTFDAKDAVVAVQAPSAASHVTGLLQTLLPPFVIWMSILPTTQDGELASEHAQPQDAGPPVGAVTTVVLGP